jgi:ERCC4-type nuclease
MITYEDYKTALSIVKEYRKQCADVLAEIDQSTDKYYELRNRKLDNTLLSARAINVLFFGGFGLERFRGSVKDLANISRMELMRCKNSGRKTVSEIEDLCREANISMLP